MKRRKFGLWNFYFVRMYFAAQNFYHLFCSGHCKNESLKIPWWKFHSFSLLYFYHLTYCLLTYFKPLVILFGLYLAVWLSNFHMKNGLAVTFFTATDSYFSASCELEQVWTQYYLRVPPRFFHNLKLFSVWENQTSKIKPLWSPA